MPNTADPTSGGQFCEAGYNTTKTVDGSAQTPCEKGTYQPTAGQPSCLLCPGGRKCDEAGLSTPKDCDAGHYCLAATSLTTGDNYVIY